MITQFTEKAKAAGIHLVLSILVIALFFAVIFFIWFPNDLVYAGALDGLQLVVLVDLVLGPLLTFVVFNTQKKSLKLDLSVIVLIQLAALVYGGKTVFDERPVMAVLGTNGVHLATASQIQEWNIDHKYLTYSGPAYHYLDVENDLAKIMPAEAVHVFMNDTPYTMQVEQFKPLDSVDNGLFLERVTLIVDRLAYDTAFTTFIASDKRDNESCVWLPLISKHIDEPSFVCLDQQAGIKTLKIMSTSPL